MTTLQLLLGYLILLVISTYFRIIKKYNMALIFLGMAITFVLHLCGIYWEKEEWSCLAGMIICLLVDINLVRNIIIDKRNVDK